MKSGQRISKQAHEATDELYEEIDAVKASLKELRTDVVDVVSHAFGIGRGGAHAAKDTATDAVDQLKSKLTDLRTRGTDSLSAIERRIEEKPMQAALVAFGLGFVAAIYLSRR